MRAGKSVATTNRPQPPGIQRITRSVQGSHLKTESLAVRRAVSSLRTLHRELTRGNVMTIRRGFLSLLLTFALVTAGSAQPPVEIPYDVLAQRIVTALKVDRKASACCCATTRPRSGRSSRRCAALLDRQGRTGRDAQLRSGADFQARLAATDIYIWLPAGDGGDARGSAGRPGQVARRRQGPPDPLPLESAARVDPDGLAGVHSAAFDRIYVDALDIDYAKLSRDQDKVIAKLRSGEVRVTTPAGTDIRFRVGDRSVQQAGRRRVEGAHGQREDARRSRDRAAGRRAARGADREPPSTASWSFRPRGCSATRRRRASGSSSTTARS